MSKEMIANVWELSGLSVIEKLTLLAIADHADKDGECWPGMDLIALKSSQSRRNAQRVVASLVKKGLLGREYRKHQSSVYVVLPRQAEKAAFYASWEWQTLRMKTLKRHGRRCLCCGAKPGEFTVSGEPVRLHVDHIKPLSKHWELRLDPENVQVLCAECNKGKGAWDETDWRESAA